MANNNITKTAHYKLNTIGRDQTDVLFIDYRDLEMGVGANSNAQIIDAEMYKMQTAITGKAGTAVATTSADGLMAKTDKAKLDGVAASANNYTHPSNHPSSMITGLPTSLPANGGNAATVNGKTVESNVPVNAKFTDTVYTHPNDANTRHVTDSEKTAWNGKASTAVVTTAANGLMIAADKTKLNGIAASANNYAHPSTHPASMITGLPVSLPASDVYAWAKAATKPSYSQNEISGTPNYAGRLTGNYTGSGGYQKPTYFGIGLRLQMMNSLPDTSGGYHDVLVCNSYISDVPICNALAMDKAGGKSMYLLQQNANSETWINAGKFWHSGNFNPDTKAPLLHNHSKSQITDFPSTLPANGGNAATVNGKTVESNVPINAKFTDTIYTHPASHPASMITGLPTSLPANGGNADTLDGLHSSSFMAANTSGLGTNCVSIGDWNHAITNGWYMASGAGNAPNSGWWYGIAIVHHEGWLTQEIWGFANTYEKMVRHKQNGTWGSWYPLSQIATISQSAPGGFLGEGVIHMTF